MQRPEAPEALARTWRRVLIPNGSPGFQQSQTLDAWLTQEFKRDLRYDQFVRDVLTVTGTIEPSRATVFYQVVGRDPENLAEVSARSFLGIRIGCAKCHDHPLAEWKKADYWKFAAFFSGLKQAMPNPIQPNVRQSIDDPLVFTIKPADDKTTYSAAALKCEPVKDQQTSPRKQLAEWITAKENPWFSAHFVNRTWQQLIGQPIVAVVDDLDTVSKAERSVLLDPLADAAAQNEYRVKILIQAIMLSKMYRLSAGNPAPQTGGSAEGATTVSRRALKSLSAEQVYNSLEQSLGLPIDTAARAENAAERTTLINRLREGASDVPTEFSSGVPQSLLLMNGQFIRQGTDLTSSRTLRAIVDAPYLTDDQRIENLFLGTLTRLPTDVERQRIVDLLSATSSNRSQVFADVFWSLLNSPEFVLCR